MNTYGKIAIILVLLSQFVCHLCEAQTWLDMEMGEEDSLWFGEAKFVDEPEEIEQPLTKKDSIRKQINADIVISAGEDFIIGIEEPYHDILMDGTEQYYYKYGLLNNNLDTVLKVEHDEIVYLPGFEYIEEGWDVWDDDGPISRQDLRDYQPRYHWLLGSDEIAFVFGSINIEKYDETSRHDEYIKMLRATKGYMFDTEIQDCLKQTKAYLVDGELMDTQSHQYLTPLYDGLIINFTKDFILVGADEMLGLIDRYSFKEVLQPVYENIVVDPKENLLYVEKEDNPTGYPEVIEIDSLTKLIKR